MNILIIGNGFDLAHGLPTKYIDFLEFVEVIKQVVNVKSDEDLQAIKYGGIHSQVQMLVKENMSKRDNLHTKGKMWNDLIGNNIWIEYFLECKSLQKENWIDFESEISKVIQSLDSDMNASISQRIILEDKIQRITNEFLNRKYNDWFGKKTYKELRDTLLNDLNKLIRALEIYLCEYVEKIEIQEKSPDIDELEIDHVLSFNYTHIYSHLYKMAEKIGEHDVELFDYIHGEANINNTIESNDMVLGIDEYLLGDRKNTDIEFIDFKKYYQRIYKETGCKYKNWVDIIKKDEKELKQKFRNEYPDQIPFKKCIGKQHYLYILGHSLDITDKDILRDLILNDNVYTTIFYHGKDTMGQQIANLVKVIGQDELIRRTGGSTKTIEFKQQQEMVRINLN